jgi:putative phosphoesterase
MKLLIVSDIHANLPALQQIQESADAVVFLGDAVNFGPAPSECVDWIKQHAIHLVRGNHDHALAMETAARVPEANRMLVEESCRRHRALLSPSQRQFLAEIPIEARFTFGGARFYLVHASPQDPLYAGIQPDDPAGLAAALAPIDADVVLVGHTHRQWSHEVNGKLVGNPGSVGLPLDGDPRAAYAIWDDGALSLRRVEYPVQQTIRALHQQSLSPEHLARVIHLLQFGG